MKGTHVSLTSQQINGIYLLKLNTYMEKGSTVDIFPAANGHIRVEIGNEKTFINKDGKIVYPET